MLAGPLNGREGFLNGNPPFSLSGNLPAVESCVSRKTPATEPCESQHPRKTDGTPVKNSGLTPREITGKTALSGNSAAPQAGTNYSVSSNFGGISPFPQDGFLSGLSRPPEAFSASLRRYSMRSLMRSSRPLPVGV